MGDVATRSDKVNDFEVGDNKPTSEGLLHKMCGDINGMIDTTNTQTDQVNAILSRQVAQSSIGGNQQIINVGVVYASVSITPSQSKVAVFLNGYIRAGFNTIIIKRNGAIIYSQKMNASRYGQGFRPIAFANTIDTGATAGLSNTYTLEFSPTSPVGGSFGNAHGLGIAVVEV